MTKFTLEKLTKEKIHIWACDYSKNTGEGKLARLFVEDLLKKRDFIIKINKKTKFSNYRYLYPFIGILYCWKHFLLGKKICYINYLPLWNFLIFLLLPPNTLLGPITGGAKFSKYSISNFYFRKFFFPIFYKISQQFLLIRSSQIIFSTDLLKKYLSKSILRKSKLNFAINQINMQKQYNYKKNIDLLLYYRKHKNKKSFFPYNFVKKIALTKYKIFVVGDKLNIRNIKNLGFLRNENIKKLQSRSRFTLASGENIYSFFTIECLSNGVTILVDKKYKRQIKFFKNKFLTIDYNKLNKFSDLNKYNSI